MSSLVLDRPMIAANEEVAQKLEAIQNWPHWDDIVQGTIKEYHVSRKDVKAALPEYQRFLAMIATYGVQVSMFSVEVDKVWHAHILNTQLYTQFCEQIMGRFVHHVPVLGVNRDCITPETTCSTQCSTRCDTCKTPAVEAVNNGYCACTPDDDGGKKCSSDPDPSTQGKARVSLVIDPELSAAERFRLVYRQAFGEQPPAIWNLPEEEVDGVAVPA